MSPLQDRVYQWLTVWVILAVAVAVDPPFGFAALSTVGGVVAGALIGIGVSRYYFRQSSHQLEEEIVQLARVMGVLARYMERDGLLKDVELDERGRLVGWAQTLKAGGIPSEESMGGGTLVQDPPPAQEGSQENP